MIVAAIILGLQTVGVILMSAIVVISLLFAPGRGIISRLRQQRKNKLSFQAERRENHVSAI